MDEVLKRDQNHITVLGGITDDSNQDIVMLRVDPVTKRLLISATVTALANLVVGTSTITGGTTTRILYDNAGVVGEYTISGSGTIVAMATAPTFGTSITGSYLTASEILITDGSKNIVSAPVATYPSLTELSYVKGVTSSIQSQINALDSVVILKGTWDASAGTFPGSGVAQAGWSYIVSVGGTVDGVVFNANDRIVAITDNASTTVYASNWFKLDYTDQVLSVFGRTGTITATDGDYSQSLITGLKTSDSPQFAGIELGNASDTTLARVSAGVVSIEGVNIATVSATQTLTNKSIGAGKLTLEENASIALDPAGSADGKYTGITVTGVAGATIAFGDLITLDKDDSRWELVDISVAAAATGDARGILGMAVSAGNDGDTITILLEGIIRADANFPTLTIGAQVFASTTGDIVVTQPTTTDYVIRVIGSALTADEIFFRPDYIWYSHT